MSSLNSYDLRMTFALKRYRYAAPPRHSGSFPIRAGADPLPPAVDPRIQALRVIWPV